MARIDNEENGTVQAAIQLPHTLFGRRGETRDVPVLPPDTRAAAVLIKCEMRLNDR